MKVLFSIFITVTAFAVCAKKKMETQISPKPVAGSHTYLALGDSYTIGESVPLNESYPYQLATQLSQKNYPVSTPKIIAVTGWTTDDLISAIDNSGIKGNAYDTVTLLIGVNDQYQGLSQENYKVKFQQVLNTAITFAGGSKKHVFVISIPDYGVTPFANGNDKVIGPQIDQFNAINKNISDKAGVNYIDITPISKKAATDLTLVAGDGLHPSGKMYALWMEELLPRVIFNLK